MNHERRFDPKNVERLENPGRVLQFPVDAILDAAGVCGMLNVADIGAGSGYFTLPMAHRVTPGKVFAVDPSPELLGLIRGKLAGPDAPKNIKLVEGEASATGLADASCDLVFLSAVWHEIDSHNTALREFSRIAAPNAKLAIVDWIPGAAHPPGPPTAHRIARSSVEQALEKAGWGVVKSDVVNEWVYIVVGQK